MKNLIDKVFKESIVKNEVKDFVADLSEVGIDQIIENPILKELPVVKFVLSFYKAGIGIKERHTIKKLIRFLYQLKDTSDKERQNFVASLEKQNKNDLFEKILIILERFDDVEKAQITGNLFKATILDKIQVNDFFKLASIIDRSYIDDIKAFCYRRNDNVSEETRLAFGYRYSSMTKKNLASLGLLNEIIITKKNPVNDYLEYSFNYEENDLGRTLSEFAY
jgi:hypothetical protein